MSKNKDSMWERLVKRLLGERWMERPAIDVEANTKRLGRLAADDPVYNLMLDHAFNQFANDLDVVLTPTNPPEVRLAAANAAVGLKRFIMTVESGREGWNLIRMEEEENAKAESAKAESGKRSRKAGGN